MDSTTILTALGTFVSGGGIMALINWRANRRRAEAEAKQAEAEANKTVVEGKSMSSEIENRFIDQLQEQQDKYLAIIDKKDKKIDELQKDYLNLATKHTTAVSNICVHQGCGIRLPSRGLGRKWMDSREEDPDLGGDFDSIEMLYSNYKAGKGNGGENIQ